MAFDPNRVVVMRGAEGVAVLAPQGMGLGGAWIGQIFGIDVFAAETRKGYDRRLALGWDELVARDLDLIDKIAEALLNEREGNGGEAAQAAVHLFRGHPDPGDVLNAVLRRAMEIETERSAG